jgi:hypothetical protein
VLKKASRNFGAGDVPDVPDVRADDPDHAQERFTDGLRRVLAAPKPRTKPRRRKRVNEQRS